MRNYIVVRESPDWLGYDLESSRQFCRRSGLPETAVIEMADAWDRALAVDYRHFRAELKRISTANLYEVSDAEVLAHWEFRSVDLGGDDYVIFVDDDDWLAPEVFVTLRQQSLGDGALWSSVRVGSDFSPNRVEADTGMFSLRPTSNVVYTNNYAMTGRALRRVGLGAAFEHYNAQKASDDGRFRPACVPRYLSAANKHPASTVAAAHFWSPERRLNIRSVLSGIVAEMEEVAVPADLGWAVPPIEAVRGLLRATIH